MDEGGEGGRGGSTCAPTVERLLSIGSYRHVHNMSVSKGTLDVLNLVNEIEQAHAQKQNYHGAR